jgi:hypothetical protein
VPVRDRWAHMTWNTTGITLLCTIESIFAANLEFLSISMYMLLILKASEAKYSER